MEAPENESHACEKHVSFMVVEQDSKEIAETDNKVILQTSTPFVKSVDDGKPKSSALDESLFNYKAAEDGASSLEISSINQSSTQESGCGSIETSTESTVKANESSDVASLDKGFIESSSVVSEGTSNSNTITSCEATCNSPPANTNSDSQSPLPDAATSTIEADVKESPPTKAGTMDTEALSHDQQELKEVSGCHESMSVSSVTSNSVYLDSSSAIPRVVTRTKRKRMTMAERATMEALEAFGGSDFGSVLRKGESFGERLEKDKESRKNVPDRPPSKKKRSERAREEVGAVFEGVPLGRAKEEAEPLVIPSTKESEVPPTGRRLTRVEQARIEALKSFGGAGLDDILSTSKRKVANTLEPRKEKEDTENEDDEEKENIMETNSI